jgi:hypothetical protein
MHHSIQSESVLVFFSNAAAEFPSAIMKIGLYLNLLIQESLTLLNVSGNGWHLSDRAPNSELVALVSS